MNPTPILAFTHTHSQSLATLFRNLMQAYDVVCTVQNETVFKNKKKQLQGQYRRFQVERNVDIGTILYYNHLIERFKRSLEMEEKLEQPRKIGHDNPYIKRFRNYETNQLNRSKIDMSQFIN